MIRKCIKDYKIIKIVRLKYGEECVDILNGEEGRVKMCTIRICVHIYIFTVSQSFAYLI